MRKARAWPRTVKKNVRSFASNKSDVMTAICTLLLVAATMVSSAFAQTSWQLSKNKNGIKVYTATSTSSAFKSIKVEAVLTGSVERLAAILMDVENNNKWVYNTRHSHLIRKPGPDEVIYYAETSLPFPVNNRDMAIRMRFDWDTINDHLMVKATGVPDEVPRKDGRVRIPYFNGFWDVRSQGNNKLSIQYLLDLDPGGSIPPLVSNMFVSKGPYETFNNLARLLAE